jgi:hypothetical protein
MMSKLLKSLLFTILNKEQKKVEFIEMLDRARPPLTVKQFDEEMIVYNEMCKDAAFFYDQFIKLYPNPDIVRYLNKKDYILLVFCVEQINELDPRYRHDVFHVNPKTELVFTPPYFQSYTRYRRSEIRPVFREILEDDPVHWRTDTSKVTIPIRWRTPSWTNKFRFDYNPQFDTLFICEMPQDPLDTD